jgi:cobalamin biosynthesis protein CobT
VKARDVAVTLLIDRSGSVYKRFGATDLNGIADIDCGHENPDGEALAWAATRQADHLAARAAS